MPASIASLELTGIPGRWERADAFARGRLRLAAMPHDASSCA